MAGHWTSSTRRGRLPTNWQALRQHVLDRDGHRCTHTTPAGRCPEPATEVDHLQPVADDHRPEALTSLCRTHHAAKSSAEGNQVWAARRARGRHPGEPHPGGT